MESTGRRRSMERCMGVAQLMPSTSVSSLCAEMLGKEGAKKVMLFPVITKRAFLTHIQPQTVLLLVIINKTVFFFREKHCLNQTCQWI